MTMPEPTPAAIAAAIEYLRLKTRAINPDGVFDRYMRWTPSHRLSCCESIRRPTAAYPYSLMTHCRTAVHVATAHGIPMIDLRRAVKTARAVLTVRTRLHL